MLEDYSSWWKEMTDIIKKTLARKARLKNENRLSLDIATNIDRKRDLCWSCRRDYSVIDGMCHICSWKSK